MTLKAGVHLVAIVGSAGLAVFVLTEPSGPDQAALDKLIAQPEFVDRAYHARQLEQAWHSGVEQAGLTKYCIRLYGVGASPSLRHISDPYADERTGVRGFRIVEVSPRSGTLGFEPAPEPKAKPADSAPKPAANPPTPLPMNLTPHKPAQPTLDDLLGLAPAPPPKPADGAKPEGPVTPDAGAIDPSRANLDRMLTGDEVEDAFKKAVALMGDAASRLDDHRDAGIDTQRIQEQALKNLEDIISKMDENSSQQSQSQQQKQKESQSQPKPSATRAEKPSNQPNQTGDPNAPTLQQGPLKPGLESARAAWGSLPQRVRDMLLQGSSDRFSSKYQQLTEQYYRKLAEEGSK